LAPAAERFCARRPPALPPGLVAVLRHLALDAVEQLPQHHLCSRRRSDVDVAGAAAISIRIDVDARDLRVATEARRCGVADNIVHPRADA
jgi:hypothetical protein